MSAHSIATSGYLDGALAIATDGLLVETQDATQPSPPTPAPPSPTPTPTPRTGGGPIRSWFTEAPATAGAGSPDLQRVIAAAVGVALQGGDAADLVAASLALALEDE
jgi:hypothetical protein